MGVAGPGVGAAAAVAAAATFACPPVPDHPGNDGPDDQQQNVAAASALHDAIYRPDDIQKGNTKDYFDDPRKIIHPTDKDILFQFDHLFFSLTIY